MKPNPKTAVNKILITGLALVLFLGGCQEPFINVQEPDKGITITGEDQIAGKILKVVLKDGSFDNFIDRCSEISIRFPYSVRYEQEIIPIASAKDIETLMFDYFFHWEDIEIVYPITVSLSNYTELTLSDPDELDDLQELFNGDLEDDDIECLDFVYPIEVAVYNTTTQRTALVTIPGDKEMHTLFSDVTDLYLEISFPITLKSTAGQEITIEDNYNLEEQIDQLMDLCDEEDEVEFSEEDYPLIDLMSNGDWWVTQYSDTTNETAAFNGYTFDFRTDLLVRVNNGDVLLEGDWEPDVSNDSIYVELDFDTDEIPLVWLNHEWVITLVNQQKIELEAESDFDGFVKTLHLEKTQ